MSEKRDLLVLFESAEKENPMNPSGYIQYRIMIDGVTGVLTKMTTVFDPRWTPIGPPDYHYLESSIDYRRMKECAREENIPPERALDQLDEANWKQWLFDHPLPKAYPKL